MARNDLSEIQEGRTAMLVDHHVDRQRAADHLDDLQLVLVQRVAVEDTIRRQRMLHIAR